MNPIAKTDRTTFTPWRSAAARISLYRSAAASSKRPRTGSRHPGIGGVPGPPHAVNTKTRRVFIPSDAIRAT